MSVKMMLLISSHHILKEITIQWFLVATGNIPQDLLSFKIIDSLSEDTIETVWHGRGEVNTKV